jgi:peroxiredoxin
MPDFNLQDQYGIAHNLRSLLGPKGAVILFYRSADWCPYCKSQLLELQQNEDGLQAVGVGLAAVSYDNLAVLHKFSERRGIRFPLLSDATSRIIRQLGILNESVAADHPYFGSPHPCLFVLDATGTIVGKYFEDDHRRGDIFGNILTQKFSAASSARNSEVESKQLKVLATASHSIVTAGQRVALTLGVELKPRMHVYAQGVEGFIPIEWKFKESDTIAKHEVRYPASERLHLEAVGKTVPVYRGHFRLRGEITIADDDRLRSSLGDSGTFTVEGTFQYQACDDRICYTPQKHQVKWTFHNVGSDKGDLHRKTPGTAR